jgi:N-acetylglucosaminyldiphosphoundecaprenol N-acetyl-beta-D-mannosaminyltransferase
VNLDHVVNLRTSPLFQQAYAWAWRVTIDGAPVHLYSKLVGVRVPARITGANLFAELVDRWQPDFHKLYFVISSDEAARRMQTLLSERGFEEGSVAFEVPPFGFERDERYSATLAHRIKLFAPSHLIMAVGAPKSEIWAHAQNDELGDLKILSIGAAVEFVVGMKKRSPRWMQRAGLEWFWRFASEPRRLFRRYFIDSFGFLLAIAADLRSDGARVSCWLVSIGHSARRLR